MLCVRRIENMALPPAIASLEQPARCSDPYGASSSPGGNRHALVEDPRSRDRAASASGGVVHRPSRDLMQVLITRLDQLNGTIDAVVGTTAPRATLALKRRPLTQPHAAMQESRR